MEAGHVDEAGKVHLAESCAGNRAGMTLVCLQGQDEKGLYGRLVNGYLEEALEFHGVAELILKLDAICDMIGSPQRSAEPRHLNAQMRQEYEALTQKYQQAVKKEEPFGGVDMEHYIQTLKAREVLVVQVEYRQNASLQGRVRSRITDDEQVSFRSALELMRMFSMIRLS